MKLFVELDENNVVAAFTHATDDSPVSDNFVEVISFDEVLPMMKYENETWIETSESLAIRYEKESNEIRQERDHILATEVDPLVSNPLRWGAMTTTEQAEWTTYRQDLLGVPQQEGFPNTVAWPVKPS